MKFTRRQADVLCDAIGPLQKRLPFANRYDLFARREWQQAVESPHTTERDRVVAARPSLFEFGQRRRRLDTIPIVNHVQQLAAIRAGDMDLVDAEFTAARRRDTSLKGNIDGGADANSPRLLVYGTATMRDDGRDRARKAQTNPADREFTLREFMKPSFSPSRKT